MRRSELRRVVITGHSFLNLDPEREVLAGVADVIETQPTGCEEVIAATRDADGIINQNSQISAEVVYALDKCKVIVAYGIGTDKIAIDAATRRGIHVCNVPNYCVDEVATHAIALILAFERNVMGSMRRLVSGHYDHPTPGSIRRLAGRTLGLLGFGRIGRRVAELARPFGLRLIVHDPFVKIEDLHTLDAKSVDFDTVLSASHYLSIHAPLNAETRGLIGASNLSKLRRDAVLINVSRGKIVQESALVDALQAGRLRGAALDVFETEPLSADSPLLRLPNVVLTPHTAWYSDESQQQLKFEAADEVRRVLCGERPRNPVNALSA